MKKLAIATLVAAALVAVPVAWSAGGLVPGGTTAFAEAVDVNVVFVGLDDSQVPWSQVAAQLPATSSPLVRSRLAYGITEPLGITYTYSFNPVRTSDAWNTAFFSFLASQATAKPLTLFQETYNTQANRTRTIDSNAWIDAPTVEKYLIDNRPAGVDTTKPTVYFINWSSGFQYHVYTKTDEPDPDTGTNFGLVRNSRKIVAWGGTTPDDPQTGLGSRGVNRVWFYDVSAGPESWGGSYDVDSLDVDGDGVKDYRIPTIWQYSGTPLATSHPGYGTATLATDLGKVLRYVGLDLLFTTSPLYPPYFSADKLPATVNLDVNTLEGWGKVDASRDLITPDLFLQKERALPTGFNTTLTADYQDLGFSGDFARCYMQWVKDNPCFSDHADYPGFANIFLATALNTRALFEGTAPYEAGLVNFSVGAKPKGAGLLGFADDNWLDGTQSGVFSFVYPDAVAAGYGLTTTMIHEYGHHSSMSHPHDGYDPASGVDFGPGGDTYFAWLGDESNSMMSYIDLNWDFSQFDRDNSARHHAAGYAIVANRIAARLVGKPAAAAGLATADTELDAARTALAAHDYDGMLAHAKAAYGAVVAGAAAANVSIAVAQPSTWTVAAPAKNGLGHAKLRAGARDLAERENLKRFQP